MSGFNLDASLQRARQRFGPDRVGGRRPRSDRGTSRIDPRIITWLVEVTAGYDRPKIPRVLSQVADRCRTEGLEPPSRATVYKLLDTLPTQTYRLADLPRSVRDALYNLGPDGEVPGHQLAFYCVNYGDLAAVSFAAGLPWLALHQALKLRGFRGKSRGLLEAIARVRGL